MFRRYQSFAPLVIPMLFIFIYGSGFVGAKLGLTHAEPFTFLALRFALAAIILWVIAFVINEPWPKVNIAWLLISGLLLQGMFSAGVFYAQYLDMQPAVAALITALQPLLIAVLGGYYLGERVSLRRWLGLLLGIVGVSIVVADGLTTEGITWLSLSCALLGLLGLTLGQLVQKKHCASMGLFTGGCFHSAIAAVAMLFLAVVFESMQVNWSTEFFIALTWMGVGVSIGALSLLFLMLRHSTANQVASLFYGVPVAAALVAWPLFGQIPSWIDWLGFVMVALSITVANSRIQLRYPLWLSQFKS